MLTRRSPLLVLTLAALVFAVAPLAQPGGALVTGEPATQTVELAPGPNVVSLYVLPDDPSMEAVLSGLGETLRSVKDPGGPQGTSVYVPSRGVRDLNTWDWRTAYVVDVAEAAQLEVVGTRIDPASAVSLTEGWNYLPYLLDRPMPADSAFASIAEAVDWSGSAGEVEFSSASGAAGTVLEPGRGYRVYATRRATLDYTETTRAPRVPTDHTVATIAEAVALRGLVAGETVRVEGYYAPGDGGGGVFDVTESGRGPDGGTVFVPREHQSAEVVRTAAFLGTQRAEGVPDGQDVVFGSLTLDLLDPDDNLIVSLPGEHLHGHTFSYSKGPLRPLFSYEGGVLRDYASRISKFFNDALDSHSAYREGRLRFTYRHTTSDLRLERQGVGPTVDVTWFGARTERENPGFDNQPVICQAMNTAQALNESGGRVETVLLPKLETYGYFGIIEIPDGITLRGAGGTYLARATDDLGNAYRPVRIRNAHTRLRLLDGEALQHLRMLRPKTDPYHLPPDAKFALGTRSTRLSAENDAMFAGIEDLVLDGNWEGNMNAWDEGWAKSGELETWLRNAPGWSGFTATNHGKSIPLGQEIVIRNTAIIGYAATGLVGHRDNVWTTENLLVGDVLYNHGMYGANGTHTNLTLTGFAWGHVVWIYGNVYNLVYEKGSVSPIGRETAEVFGIRGGDAYDADELTHGVYRRDDGTVLPLQTKIVGFYFDLRGSDSEMPFAGIGSKVSFTGASNQEPGVFVAPTSEVLADGVYGERANGYQKALYHSNRIENVVVYDLEGRMTSLLNTFNVTDSAVRNVRVERPNGRGGRSLTLAAGRRNHPAWDVPQVQLFEGIHDGPTHFVARVQVDDDNPAGMDVFVRNSTFNNRTNTLYHGRSGTGELDRFDGDPSKLKVHMAGVSFNLFENHLQNLELFFVMTRFQRCTDQISGRTSESSRTLRASDFDGREAVVPLGLFWAPQDRSYVAFSGTGASAVASWEIVDSKGNALGEDQRDPHLRVRLSESLGSRTITVDAAVRPWEDGVSVPASLED